jgi:choline kinase
VFFLQMVDHLFPEPTLALLAATALESGEVGRVLVDSTPSRDIDLDDATKVQLDRARVSAIGKTSPPGCDRRRLLRAHARCLRRAPCGAAREGRTVSSGMRRWWPTARSARSTCRGADWIDVDTPADREIAERLLGRHQLATERP